MSVYFKQLRYTHFIWQEVRIHIQPRFLKTDWLFLDTFLMVLFAISCVFSGLNNIAGNIYFALLPVQEGTAALHVLYLTVIMPHIWQLLHILSSRLIQCEKDVQSRNTDGTILVISKTHSHPKCNPVLKRTAALSSGSQLFRWIHWCVCIYTVSFKDSV